MKSLREMEIAVQGPLDPLITVGTVIENLTWTPELTIRNSRFERTNTRGILVTTRKKVLIENNVFDRTGMHAILIADDASSWYESGPVTDVTIRNNIFEGCGYNSAPNGYVISIAPENHIKAEGFYVHRNIKIENNVFRVSEPAILGARSVQDLIFRNNKVLEVGNKTTPTSTPAINLDGCDRVKVSNNIFIASWTPSLKTVNMAGGKLETDIHQQFH
jgi:polygalacturonase